MTLELLVVHAADAAPTGVAAEYRELALVNSPGTVFAGVVDPDHARDIGLGREVARVPGSGFAGGIFGQTLYFRPTLHAAQKLASARPREASTL